MLSTSFLKKVNDYNFVGEEETAINTALKGCGGPPLRDPVSVLNALARLDISLPFGLDGLPVICIASGLPWKRSLFPFSAGNFRKIVAAIHLSPVETSGLEPELLEQAELAAQKFPVTWGNHSKPLQFLKDQLEGKKPHQVDLMKPNPTVLSRKEKEEKERKEKEINEAKAKEEAEKQHQHQESEKTNNNQYKAFQEHAPSSQNNNNNDKANRVTFLNRSSAKIPGLLGVNVPVIESDGEEESSSDSDFWDDDEDEMNNNENKKDASSSSTFLISNPENAKYIQDELYHRSHSEKEETELVLKDMFSVPRPIIKRKNSMTGNQLLLGNNKRMGSSSDLTQLVRENSVSSPTLSEPSSPTAVCFSADKVGTFFDNFGIHPRAMLKFFPNPDELEDVVKTATTASASIRRQRQLEQQQQHQQQQQHNHGDHTGDNTTGNFGDTTTTTTDNNNYFQTPSRRLSLAAGGVGGGDISILSGTGSNISATSPFGSLSNTQQTNILGASVYSSPGGGLQVSSPLSHSEKQQRHDSTLTKHDSFFGDSTTTPVTKTGGGGLLMKPKKLAQQIFDVEIDDLSWWLNTRTSQADHNTPRTSTRCRHRWRVAVFAILQTVRSEERGLDGNASAMDLLGTGGSESKSGFAGFAQALFKYNRENRLESTALKEKVKETIDRTAITQAAYRKSLPDPTQKVPELGNVDGVIGSMKYDRDVDLLLRRICVPCYGDSGAAVVARDIMQSRVHRHATDQALLIHEPATKAERERRANAPYHGCGSNAAGVRELQKMEMSAKTDVVERLLSRGPTRQTKNNNNQDSSSSGSRPGTANKQQQQQRTVESQNEYLTRLSRPTSAATHTTTGSTSKNVSSRSQKVTATKIAFGAPVPERNERELPPPSPASAAATSQRKRKNNVSSSTPTPSGKTKHSSSTALTTSTPTPNYDKKLVRPQSASNARSVVAKMFAHVSSPAQEKKVEKEEKENASSPKRIEGKKKEEEKHEEKETSPSSSRASSTISSVSSYQSTPEKHDDENEEEKERAKSSEANNEPQSPKQDEYVNSLNNKTSSSRGDLPPKFPKSATNANNNNTSDEKTSSSSVINEEMLEKWTASLDSFVSPNKLSQSSSSEQQEPTPTSVGTKNAETIRNLRQQAHLKHIQEQQKSVSSSKSNRRHSPPLSHRTSSTNNSRPQSAVSKMSYYQNVPHQYSPSNNNNNNNNSNSVVALDCSLFPEDDYYDDAEGYDNDYDNENYDENEEFFNRTTGTGSPISERQNSRTSLRRRHIDHHPPELETSRSNLNNKPCRLRSRLDQVMHRVRVSDEKKLLKESIDQREMRSEVVHEQQSVMKKIGSKQMKDTGSLYGKHLAGMQSSF